MSASRTSALAGNASRRVTGGGRRSRRWRELRRGVGALLILVVVLGAVAALAYDGQLARDRRQSASPTALARRAVSAFFHRYVRASGQVVRIDQGGDTVSEGEAYGLLLALAVRSPTSFSHIWRWERTHLQEPDGLFAWHFARGRIVGTSPASDADVLTAWALVRAATTFKDPRYLVAGRRIAAAVLARETVRRGRHLFLAAGPWATHRPILLNPSYLVPEAFGALSAATATPAFRQLRVDSARILLGLERKSPAGLPPDWATVSPTGAVQPSGAPATEQAPRFSLNAERVALWYEATCSHATRAVAANQWAGLRGAGDHGGAIAYSLAGRRLTSLVSPLGYLAEAAAATAAGARSAATLLVAAAARQQRHHPTYYGGAWLALGRVLLQTNWLVQCR